jgi:ribose transport system substrate-binding protein
MNATKKINFFAIIVIFALIATACAPAASTPQAPAVQPTPQTIIQTQVVEKQVVQTVVVQAPTQAPYDCTKAHMAYISFGSQYPYIAKVDKSMQDASKAAGINLLFLDNKNDAAQAMTNAQTVASHGDINLVFEFNYYQEENPAIAEIFANAKIPVIAIDIPLPGAPYYGANNYVSGELAGQGLVDAAKAKWGGDNPVDLFIVETQKAAGSGLLADRTNGIIAGVQKALPNLPKDAIVQFEGGTNPDAAATGATTVLTAHPNAKHVIVGMLGDSNAVAVLNAAQAANRTDILASGIGGDDVGIAALRTGKPAGFVGTTLFFPENYGKDLIPMGCDLLAGKQVAADVYIKHAFLTAKNLSQYYP